MDNIRKIVKDIIRESSLIYEGATDILYHFTSLGALYNILKTNTISLTSAAGTKADLNINKGRFFFFSLTRSKSSGYRSGKVKIVFDGRKLSSKYKIIPVDYWQYSKSREDWHSDESYIESLKSSEQEDRIVSNNSKIDNAISYIKELHILVNISGKNLNYYKNISSICSNEDIAVYYYKERKDWLSQNTNKVIFLSQIEKEILERGEFESDIDDDYYSENRFNYDVASLIAYNSPEGYSRIKEYLNDKNKVAELDKVLKKRTRENYSFNANYFEDGWMYLTSQIHRMRARPDSNSRFLLKLLADEMIKHKSKNVLEYLENKRMKGRKTIFNIKEELFQYLNNTIDNSYSEAIARYLNNKWIEIDGEYYNNLYESPEIIKFLNDYIRNIKDYLRNKIFNSPGADIFRYSYELNSEHLQRETNLKNFNFSDKINVTDQRYSDKEDLNNNLKSVIKYVLYDIDNAYYNKAKELYNEYIK